MSARRPEVPLAAGARMSERHNPRECWCGIDHSRQDPTQRVEAMTTPEGEKGWETVQSRRTDTARGHGVDVAPDSQPEGVRAETRREDDGDRGEPSNAPTAAYSPRPRLLDLFCCEGGGASGYHRAGWEVVGVDINPQPLYPFGLHQLDVLTLTPEWIRQGGFDAIHASPPCQFATVYGNNAAHVRDDHPNLIPATRELLEATGLPYVIENVEGAKGELIDPVRICGTGLDVRVRRHRYFESNWPLEGVACDHGRFTDRPFPGSSNRPNGRTVMNVGEYRVPLATQREVMEMPWADLYGISQAIPPAYTEHIGEQLLAYLSSREAVAA